MIKKRLIIIILGLVFVTLLGPVSSEGKQQSPQVPHWVVDISIPTNEPVFLVVKGIYSTRREAEKVQRFIEQLMGTTPPDRVDRTGLYSSLAPGKYLVGMVFDSQQRAKWWINFSYRNRKVPKGKIKKVVLRGKSKLPYMPDPVRDGKKRLLSQAEALALVKALPDLKKLSQKKRLQYKFTDYPRNGDLRYEIEIMESKGRRKDPVMVDFIMVSAMNGEITERLSHALGRSILSEK